MVDHLPTTPEMAFLFLAANIIVALAFRALPTFERRKPLTFPSAALNVAVLLLTPNLGIFWATLDLLGTDFLSEQRAAMEEWGIAFFVMTIMATHNLIGKRRAPDAEEN